jgi:hypothetical protein
MRSTISLTEKIEDDYKYPIDNMIETKGIVAEKYRRPNVSRAEKR